MLINYQELDKPSEEQLIIERLINYQELDKPSEEQLIIERLINYQELDKSFKSPINVLSKNYH